MPGITGFITSRVSPRNKIDLQVMVDSIMHEQFYRSDVYINEDLGLFLGWVCLKGSFSDCMPIWNEKKDKLLFFYGEDFQSPDIIENLRRRDHDFCHNNASYIIHLYEEHGKGFIEKLNGFFCGILVDLASEKILLFNDRFGMQRIYYYQIGDSIFFSTEQKAILGVHPNLRRPVPEALAELCSMGCVLNNKTLIREIFLLPGASIWSFIRGSWKKETYFNKEIWEEQPSISLESFYSGFRSLFKKILPRYLNSADKITISLTGGLDTRMIMAYNEKPPNTLPCHTFGSIYHDSFDVKSAQRVAAACGQPHHIIRVDRAFLNNFDRLAAMAIYITDGYLDVTGAAELYINNLVRNIAPIRLTGNYGSEVLRTIRAFKPKPVNSELFNADFIDLANMASELYEDSLNMHPLSFSLFKQAPWFGYNRLSIEQSQLVIRTPFMDNSLLELLYQAPRQLAFNDDFSRWLIAQGDIKLDYIATDRSLHIVSHSFLAKAKSAFNEFLRLSEFCYDYGMPQLVALIDGFLRPFRIERIFLGRHKFCHFRVWYRDELSGYIKDILLDHKSINRPYYKKNAVEKIVMGHTGGYKNFTTEITQLLTIELIHKLFLE